MGHVEPDGAASAETVEELAVWGLWKRLIRFFPTWSLLPSGFWTPGAWSYVGIDFVSGFRRNRSTRQTFELLDGVDEETFDALSALANLNARRQDQMLRAVIIGYLTIPFSIIALLAQVAGDDLMAFVNAHRTLTMQFVAFCSFGVLAFFCSHWRSRQLVGVLDMIRIERGQKPFTALELRED
ncbi:hypothetical protein GCM10009422_20240 [Brevundimonas kwangchunensis]|uniref:Uncharacterized protein n=1 Tax=Brevundimonas kwangchunensis TaxID=322163 RepID=A0ABN1GYU2_9CAUL